MKATRSLSKLYTFNYSLFPCVTEDSRRIYSTASRVNYNYQKSHLQEQEDTGGFQVLFYLPDRSGSTLY